MTESNEEYRARIIKTIKDDIIQDVDGYYYFWPAEGGGYFNEFTLRVIADHLEELNKPWDDEINKYFDEIDKNEPKDIP